MEEMNPISRDFKGVWIPKKVWLDTDLNALDKIILVEIDSLDNGEKGCYASNKYLAEFCQCSESKVSRSISKLVKLGYISFKSFNGRCREIKSLLEKKQGSLGKKARQTGQKSEAESAKKQAINIDNNIDNNIDIKKERKEERKTKKLYPTSSKPDKPSISFDTLIENYTENVQLREELKEHLKVRKQKKGALTNRAIQLSLSKLDKIAADDYEKIKIVQNAIMNGWTGFFPLKPDEKKTMKKANYDIEAYERSNRELFEAYPSGDNERRYKLDQFMNPKFNQNIIDLEEEDE